MPTSIHDPLDGCGLDALDLVRLSQVVTRAVPHEQRADAAAEFVVGAVEAAARADRTRNARSYTVQGGRLAAQHFLRREHWRLRHQRPAHPAAHGPLDDQADGLLALLESPEPSPDRPMIRRELADVVQQAMRVLPARDVHLLHRRLVQGAAWSRIIEQLGVSREAATNRLNRILARLRREIRRLAPQLADTLGELPRKKQKVDSGQ